MAGYELAVVGRVAGRLSRAKFAKQLEARNLTVSDIFDGYTALATVVKPAIIAPVIARDPADDLVLATVLAAQADAIVSGDRHLLELKVYRHIPIVIAEAVKRLPA